MSDSLIRIFKDPAALDEMSVTALEHQMEAEPYNVFNRLLLAKKMASTEGKGIMLNMNDRTLLHYFTGSNTHIPCFEDLSEDRLAVPASMDAVYGNAEEKLPELGLEESAIVEKHTSEETPAELVIIPEEKEIPVVNSGISKENVPVKATDTTILKTKKVKKKKFKLNEYSGISEFSKWLLSFKEKNVEHKIRKEEKAAKKKALEENAKKSVTKSDAIVSEPLANLLAEQGHLDDAKKMYEHLMVKYPEKSSYFAAKINNLIKT